MSKNWVTVASFSQPFEAHLAKTRLEAEEIPCVVSDEYLVRVDWLLSNAVTNCPTANARCVEARNWSRHNSRISSSSTSMKTSGLKTRTRIWTPAAGSASRRHC